MRSRTILRWTLLAAAGACVWPARPESWGWTSVLLPALSPYVAVGGTLAARSVNWLALAALPAMALAWFLPRVLCRYVCPIGLLQEKITQSFSRGRRPARRFPSVGPVLAVATLAGAGCGFPLFLWLDPFAAFNGGLNAWRWPLAGAGMLAGLGLPALLVLELVLPQVWCRRLCPLGGVQDGFTLARRWLVHRPTRGATAGETRELPPAFRGRRTFLAACSGAAGACALRAMRASPPPLRPPGSLPEASFAGVCVRCGNCANVCPPRIIHPDLGGRPDGWLAPRLSFAEDYCRENCRRCQEVCPSGAIRRLPLPAKRETMIGVARVEADTCQMVHGGECTACVRGCPYEAISIGSAGDGFSSQPVVDIAKCNGCGACEALCPVRPVKSVRVFGAAQSQPKRNDKRVDH